MSVRYPEPAVYGVAHYGSARYDVYDVPPLFEKLIEQLKRIGAESVTVTWRKRSESGEDSETGKPTYTFTDQEISALVRPLSISEVALPPGVKVDELLRIWTIEPIKHFDQIVWREIHYEVQAPQKQKVGQRFICWMATLKRIENP